MKSFETFQLSGRAALITGAGVGIGREIAFALAGAGAVVGIHYHSSETAARATLEKIQEGGGQAVLLHADLTNEEQANSTIDNFLAHAGRLDILVNNAGSPLRFIRIEDCPTALWHQ